VRDSPLTQRQVEEINGFRQGYLSQVLKGHITLSMRHMVGIMYALEEAPGQIFDGLMEPNTHLGLDEIREKLERYDRAFDTLEAKGLLAPLDTSKKD
jgi:transcriptional regulator with XRE-family HTH domain